MPLQGAMTKEPENRADTEGGAKPLDNRVSSDVYFLYVQF